MLMFLSSNHHDIFTKGCLIKNFFDLRQKDRINDQHLGATVIEHMEEILGLHKDVGRDGHGP